MYLSPIKEIGNGTTVTPTAFDGAAQHEVHDFMLNQPTKMPRDWIKDWAGRRFNYGRRTNDKDMAKDKRHIVPDTVIQNTHMAHAMMFDHFFGQQKSVDR